MKVHVREKPILFSGEMVRAVLDGRKTQTRRVAKTPEGYEVEGIVTASWDVAHVGKLCVMNRDEGESLYLPCPYGAVGDRLWVRETWDFREYKDYEGEVEICYGADASRRHAFTPNDWHPTVYNTERWRPSIHMPRWASRTNLEITEVRVERLQEISTDDCEAEGVAAHMFTVGEPQPLYWTLNHPESRCLACAKKLAEESEDDEVDGGWGHQEEDGNAFCDDCDVPLSCLLTPHGMRESFAALWDSINEKRGYGWDTNPWVWVVSFERLTESE